MQACAGTGVAMLKYVREEAAARPPLPSAERENENADPIHAGDESHPERIVLLTNIPSPYRLPFLREFSTYCNLHVVFDAKNELGRRWTVPDTLPVPHSYARGYTINYLRRRHGRMPAELRQLHLRWGVLTELFRLRPSVVVSLEFGPRSLLSLCYCLITKTPLVLWSEGTPHTEGWVGPVKTYIRRMLTRHAARYWVNGIDSANLIAAYGGEARRIDSGMTGVDTEWFAEKTAERLTQREHLRKEFGVEGPCFIFVGELSERKGLRQLLRALEVTCPSAAGFTFLLAGEGSLRPIIQAWIDAHPECDLRLMGHLEPEALVQAYAIADVFVLPTLDDNWSLATLEAAVAGLPQVFSKFNGASTELMECGALDAHGKVIDPFDEREFAHALLLLTC
jgi:glycosyltransferase involved in cell wall biosynthesis